MITLGLVAFVAAEAVSLNIRFTESVRHESLTISESFGNSSSSETKSDYRGKFRVDVDAALNGIDGKALSPETPFALQIGGFTMRAKLGDDPGYRIGKTSARIPGTETSISGNSRIVIATAQLRWDRNRLRARVEGEFPRAKPIVIQDFFNASTGKLQAVTTAQVEFAETMTKLSVPFQGNIRRKTATSRNAYGAVTQIDVKGDGRTSD